MGYSVLLLTLLFVALVAGQSTTVTSTSSAEKVTPENEAKSKDGESEALKSEESVDKFTFTKADAIPAKQQIEAEDKSTPIKNEDALVVFETILDDEKETPEGKDVAVTIDNDDDDSDDGDGDNSDDDNNDNDDDDDEDELDDDISPDSVKPPSSILRRQGDLNPDFNRKEMDSTSYPQPRQDAENVYSSPYIISRDRAAFPDPSSDNSPLLQLTQGGYQRPYSRRGPFNSQRPIPGIASQPSETIERPVETQGNQQGPPQIVPQVAYAPAYQPQMDYRAMFRYPLEATSPFLIPNGQMHSVAQNPFFNTQPYPEFTSANVQSPFSIPNNGFSDVPRDGNGFAQYQASPMANPSLLFQSPSPFVSTQPMSDSIQRDRTQLNFFQPGNYPPYNGMNNGDAAPRPDYSAYFRSPSDINAQLPNPQFQVNPNFYGSLPNGPPSGFTNTPMNPLPGYPGSGNGSPYPTRFQVTVNHVPPQNADQQVQNQQQDSESYSSDQKPKDPEQLNLSQDKEDPVSVPFGTRIQVQSTSPNQNDFAGPRDVYIRYPMTEAGYATEENFPVQNASERNTDKNDAAQRPAFPFFNAARPYPGFSSPDPYRNALNALQKDFPAENGKTASDASNNTKETPIEQFARNVPLRFNQGPVPNAGPMFSGYPERSQDPAVMQGPPFYVPAGPGGPRSPFDPIPVYPIGNTVEKNITPECAKGSNVSLCFKDPEYPRRELLYALNSDSFLMERLVMPDQQLDGIPLVEQTESESPESQDNYICKSDLKYGMPQRAKNIKGVWKVIVNIERAIGGGKFIQPVRLEVCKAANEPCSFTTEMKTACVQKYSLQRLLSWSAEKGVHNDVYKLPVACSCQVVSSSSQE